MKKLIVFDLDGTLAERKASLDAKMAALLSDLDERGLLDSTLVVLVGEFGRTPTISRWTLRQTATR